MRFAHVLPETPSPPWRWHVDFGLRREQCTTPHPPPHWVPSPVSLACGVHTVRSLWARPRAACRRPSRDGREGGLGRQSEWQEQLQVRGCAVFTS